MSNSKFLSQRAAKSMIAAVTVAACMIAIGAARASHAQSSDTSKAKDPNQVLRHAVFFKFKDGATPEDVTRIVEAFGSLPSKISEIAGYEWGENIGPPQLGAGLTHCFLLSFKDDAGRSVYLPHPDHKAFGSVLGPHLDKVFVIDYRGVEPPTRLEKPLRHFVFFKFKDSASESDIRAIEDAFAALPAKIDAIKAFEWGRNNSPETHDAGFTHGYMLTFDSKEALDRYAKHPDHVDFARMLGPVVEDVRVIDYWAKPASETKSE